MRTVNMSERIPTSSAAGLEEVIQREQSLITQEVFFTDQNVGMSTTLEFKHPSQVQRFSFSLDHIAHFADPDPSVFGYSTIHNGKKMFYFSPSELEEGSKEVNYLGPLVPVQSVIGEPVLYQDLVRLENRQLREILETQHEEQQQLMSQTRRLKKLAMHDKLTGCFNQNAYLTHQREHIKQAVEKEHALYCSIVDLKNLKILNDVYGHDIGDEALMKLGDVLRKAFRREARDFVYRTGGDEFTIVSYGKGNSDEGGFQQRLSYLRRLMQQQVIRNPHYDEDSTVFVPQDAYLMLAADVGGIKADLGRLRAPELRGKSREWYEQIFTSAIVKPADAALYAEKLSLDDPNQETHVHTARYIAGDGTPQRVENRTRKFLRESSGGFRVDDFKQ